MIAKSKSALEGYFKIRNLDPIVKEKLRLRAKQNRRSLSREALLIPKKGVGIEDEATLARGKLRSRPTHKRKANR
jgi:plasmid stability protein